MSVYYLNRLIGDLNRSPELVGRFMQNPEEVVAGYDLTEEEINAVLQRDVGKMYELGALPILNLAFARMNQYDYDGYINAINKKRED